MLLVVTNDDTDRHDNGRWHPERPERSAAALAGLGEAGLAETIVRRSPRAATREELSLVHAPAYLDDLEARCTSGGGALDADTPFVEGSWSTALSSAGAGLEAVAGLEAGDADAAFVITRPPGHHARPGGGMGFCLLNNVAVAAAALVARGERVLVLDWDVHHGNGTQEAFWDDPRVLFVSLHQQGLYPNSGSVDETGGPGAPGSTVNVPLPAGATGDVVRAALDRIVQPAVEAFAPTWVLVSAGFDAHRADPLADLALTAGDYADLASYARFLASSRGRLVLFLEGGYDLDALRASVGAAAAAAVGERHRPEPASSGGPGLDLLPLLEQSRRRALEEEASR